MKYLDVMLEVLVTLVVFGALFPLINTQITNLGLDNISVAGTAYDFSFVAYLLVLGLLFGIMFIGTDLIQRKKK